MRRNEPFILSLFATRSIRRQDLQPDSRVSVTVSMKAMSARHQSSSQARFGLLALPESVRANVCAQCLSLIAAT